MKQFKKLVLILMCTGVMMGITACGSNGNADDNAANNNAATDQNNTTNGATDGTTYDNNNNGVADEIGDDIRDVEYK